MKIKERGYFDLTWGENRKTMHFSRLFLNELQDITGETLVQWGKNLQEATEVEEQFQCIVAIVLAGFYAYDKEEGNEIDYGEAKVVNWVFEALNEDENVLANLYNAMQESLPLNSPGKQKGKFVIPKPLR